MEFSDNNKQKQRRYDRLLKMIQNYQRPTEEIIALEKIKNDTIFQIHLKFMGCQANKKYRFPKTIAIDNQPTQQQMQMAADKNLLYDLHTQNKTKQIIQNSLKRRLFNFQNQKSNQRLEKASLSKSLSLNKIKTRYQKQKIDKLRKMSKYSKQKKIYIGSKEKQKQIQLKLKNQRIKTMISQDNSRKNILPPKINGKKSSLMQTLKSSLNLTPHIKKKSSNLGNTLPNNKKYEFFGIKSIKSNKKFKTQRGQVQGQTLLIKKFEGSNSKKNSKINELIINEIKKRETDLILNNLKQNRSKNKNLFQKAYF